MSRVFSFALVGALGLGAFAAPATAATFIVGTGAACTHAELANAIAAAEASAGRDAIRLTRSLAYTQQALSISTSQELDLLGGFDTCEDTSASGDTTLNGAGGAAEPVLRIALGTGGIVRLRNLFVTGGDEDGTGGGGGIYYRGNGVLDIADSTIGANEAALGGGIYAEGTGTTAELVLGRNVNVANNTARRNGGGVYVDSLELSIVEAGTFIAFNEALGLESSAGYGGGILVRSCAFDATLYLARSGPGDVLYANAASRGGGIAIVAGNNCDRDVKGYIYNNGGEAPSIRDNRATIAGGGLYAVGNAEFDFQIGAAAFEVRSAVIAGNRAPRGSALFLDYDDAVGVEIGSLAAFGRRGGFGNPVSTIGTCPIGRFCVDVLGNVNENANGTPAAGATIEGASDLNTFFGERIRFEGNRGDQLLKLSADIRLVGSLIVANELADAVLVATRDERDALLEFDQLTIADNAIGAGEIFRITNRDSAFTHLVVEQPGRKLVTTNDTLSAFHIVADELASVGGPSTSRILARPRFINRARGDYRLRAASPGVDAAPIVDQAQDIDALLAPRDVEIPLVPNRLGARDLGAFERQALLPILLNGDFAGNVDLWTPGLGGSYAAENATGGEPGTGSLALDVPSTQGARYTAATQCVELPGPGTYELNGSGRTVGPTPAVRDALLIEWELRAAGGDSCSGGEPIATGTVLLGKPTAWTQGVEPAAITIGPQAWTRSSSLVVRLVVVESALGTATRALGWFDRITLTPVTEAPDALFANGFE